MPYVCGEFGKTLAEHMLIAFQLADGGIRKRFYVNCDVQTGQSDRSRYGTERCEES